MKSNYFNPYLKSFIDVKVGSDRDGGGKSMRKAKILKA